MINKLLDFIDNQPKTVIVALLGVIVVGGVGGGVWIKTLVSVGATADQRISLIKAQYDRAEATMTQENLMLTEQLDILKDKMTDLSPKLLSLSEDLNKASTSDTLDESIVLQLAEKADTLKAESIGITKAFERADEMKVFADKMVQAVAVPAPPQAPSLIFPLIILVVVIVLGYFVFRRVRRGSQ